ncbi:restriction endonuclease subunit S [Acinetobacter guillouiae]|uniref:restriction endonuclease subunit S n=1 Tax=Acinetobacter TaxID=469 RepID=UPI0021D271A7|nr:restriction endonuclease subunit S [Acinetobacter bereziniae]MCU4418654.1 restriction endonuclease subunit S [Acinetobacter bereziniae]
MAKYQKYAEYKDSGVEWLGAIPGHWGVTQLKRLGKFITGMTPSTAVEAYYSDEITEYGWIRPEDILEESEKVEPTKFLTKLGWETQRTIPAQSTLICCIGTIGKLGFLGKRAVTNQQITALVPDVRGFSKYYYYLLTASRNQLEHLATGNVVKILNSERLGSLWLPLLSSQNEARQIVHFLDYETAKIDHLIEKQQQLIELLKEKRQAVISHAVTKGLNPNVKMKDSGVEWLGEVPEHWKTLNLRWKINIASGEGLSSSEIESEPDFAKRIPVIGGNGIMGFTNRSNTTSALAIGRVGALCGNVHLINYDSWITDNALKISQWNDFDSSYLVFLLEAARLNDMANKSAQPLITGEQVKSLRIVIPPLEEQKSIVLKIEVSLKLFDHLVEKAQSAIKLMQERRTALISAAVTGKIDVRNWQVPTLAEADTELSA